MTREELQAHSEANWLRVDAALRDKCVWHLRDILTAEEKTILSGWFWNNDFPPGFHMFSGMTFRNALRDVVQDGELPRVTYPGGNEYQNWDDFYMAALRQAVAPREGEV